MKSIMGIKESIRASEATNQIDSILTVLHGKRNLAFITFGDLNPTNKQTVTKLINSDPSLNSIHVKKNPLMGFVIYREGHEKEAQELANLANRYGGYLSVDATKEDSIRIGQLLDYDPQDIQDYINKHYDEYGVNIRTGNLFEFDSPDQNPSAISVLGLDEVAKTVSDLPADTGLYHQTNINIGDQFVLYSASEDKVYGGINIYNTDEDPNVYMVSRVSANESFGPLLYDMMLSYVYPKPLIPDRNTISKDAIKVWTYYFNNRNDIKKEPIDIDDQLYSTIYPYEREIDPDVLKDLLFEPEYKDTIHELDIYNSKYIGKPLNIQPLLINANKQLKLKNVNLNDLISRSGKHYDQSKGVPSDYDI